MLFTLELNSWEILLWSLFPLELSGSRRFGGVRPHWTHYNLSYDPCFLWSWVVQRGSVVLNHLELMRNCTMILVLSGAEWFKEGSAGLNYSELMRNCTMILVPSGAKWFEEVWQGWTTPKPWKLSYDPISLWRCVFQKGSAGLNHPELMRNFTMILVPSEAEWFEKVRRGWPAQPLATATQTVTTILCLLPLVTMWPPRV